MHLFFIISLFLVGFVTNVFLHELGHGLPAIFRGGGINKIFLFGYEIIPNFGVKTSFGLSFSFCQVNWPNGYSPTEYWKGLQYFSGSGFTLFVSIISLALLWSFKPKHILRYIFLILSFGFLDIFTASFLPLIGLPHRLFWGAQISEAVGGLVRMGFSKTLSLLLILFFVSVIVYFLFYYLKKHPRKSSVDLAV